MANVQNISIDGTSYSCRDNTKASKSEAIKNITRSGTTFTATRCDDTTFTFTQQDNNTTKGTTYTAGNVPANTTFGTNGSIKNAYDGLNSSKAPKSEAIKNITRSGTTFTATRCDDTTFTFTQQDNNTWRPVQNNLTSQSTTDCLSAKQGTILASTDMSPNYGSSALSSGNISPTSTGYTWTSTDHNSVVFISYWRQSAGYTLTIQVNGITIFEVPANTAGFGTATIPLLKGQKLKILTDTTSASWTCNIRAFNCNLY